MTIRTRRVKNLPDEAEIPEAAPLTDEIPEAVVPEAPTRVWVRVRADSRWPLIQAAGCPWSRVAVALAPDDPRLAELRANPYLEVLADDAH